MVIMYLFSFSFFWLFFIIAPSSSLHLGCYLDDLATAMAHIVGTKATLVGTIVGPLGSRRNIIHGAKVSTTFKQFKESLVVNDGMPHTIDLEAILGHQDTARVGMLGSNAVLKTTLGQGTVKGLDKQLDLLVEGHVLHGERAALGSAAIGDTLDFNKAWFTLFNELRVFVASVLHVEAADKRKAEDRALRLFGFKNAETLLEALPVVAVKGTVNAMQVLLVGGINRDVKLGHTAQAFKLVRVLGVAHKETGNVLTVQKSNKLINMGVENGLTYEREGAVLDSECLSETVSHNTRDTSHLLDLLVVTRLGTLKDLLRWVYLPTPCGSHGVGTMAPAKDALV